MNATTRKLMSEGVGTMLLLVAVVGSGAAVDQLASDAPALALLIHALVVGGMLVAIILAFGGTSAHFNPAVSLYFALKKELDWSLFPLFMAAQITGGILGVLLSHAMFELPLFVLGTNPRTGLGLWISEAFCTFSLIVIIVGAARQNLSSVALAVGTFIGGAIWCFSSAAFANPAVSIARCFTDSYAAIRPIDVGPFVLAQLVGVGAALVLPVGSDGPD